MPNNIPTDSGNPVRGGDPLRVYVDMQTLPPGSVTLSSGKTLKCAAVSLTSSGNVVAGVSGKLIKVYAYEIQSLADSMTVQLLDDNGGNPVTNLWTLNTREGVIGQAITPPAFLFKNSATNKPIYAALTGTGTVKILCRYWDDDAT